MLNIEQITTRIGARITGLDASKSLDAIEQSARSGNRVSLGDIG
jgi:hypothetical protein